MGQLDGKRALITGAASGIGRASALLFGREGAALVLIDVNERVREVAEQVSANGVQVEVAVGDVADDEVIARAVATSVERHGGLDVVFANAGITGGVEPVLDLTIADFRRVLDVNLLGVFACIKHGGQHMRAHGGGSIICTASVAGLRAAAGPVHYSASKAAIISLVQTTAFQLSGTGIRINAICPGLIETGMTRPIFDLARSKGKEGKIGQLNPTRRAGQPDEIAHVAAFLASDAASYINGQAIAVDGGLSAAHPFVPGKRW